MVAVAQTQAALPPREGHSGSDSDRPPSSQTDLVDVVLRETQYLYALVLLVTFVSLAAWYSVYNAKKTDEIIESQARGPGGKPLPITRKKKANSSERKLGPHFGFAAKNVFRYLAAVVFLTYVVSGSYMFAHAFKYDDPYRWSREGLSWAGEWSVVCPPWIPATERTALV